MTKYKLISIFLISLNIIKITECFGSKAMTALTEASKVHFDITIKYTPEPIKQETIAQELKKHYQLGTNLRNEYFSKELKSFLHDALMQRKDDENPDTFLSIYYNAMARIDELYKPFIQFLEDGTNVNITSMENYFKHILDNHSNGIPDRLEMIHRSTTMMIELFENMAEKKPDDASSHCGNELVLRQQHVLNFFNAVIDKSFKGYYLLIAAHKFLTRLNKENHMNRIKNTLAKSHEELLSYAAGARNALKKATKEIQACDYDADIKDKTYVEINGPSQGFIFDSTEVNPRDKCSSFDNERDRCDKRSETCFQHTCTTSGGVLKNCETISNQTLTICPATDASKKYLSAESDTKTYGDLVAAHQCPKAYKERKVTEVQIVQSFFSDDSTWEPNFFCYCSCQRSKWQPGDVRSILLEWTVADYPANKVITGLKFEEKKGMISLRAQHGVILPGGMIDQTTLSWVEAVNPEPSLSNTGVPTYRYPQKSAFSGQTLKIDENFVYMRDNLSINIDYVEVPENHVVVGVKLKKSESRDDKNQNVLELVVWSMYFDIDTGKLDQDRSEKISATDFMLNEYNHSKRQVLNITSPGNPILKDVKNIEHSANHVKVKFTETDMKKDLGQSIVPFIDIRPITATPAVPIGGVSLDHRRSPGFGGFLGLRLYSYDISIYLENLIDQNVNPPHRQ